MQVKNDPTKSIVYSNKRELEARYLNASSNESKKEITIRQRIILALFSASFVALVYGVLTHGWYFFEMTILFFGTSILIAFVSGMGEKAFTDEFVKGASDLLGVALIMALARGVGSIMENGLLSDTILYYGSQIIDGMHPGIFSTLLMFVFGIFNVFIPSSSGLALVGLPIMAPLADVIAVDRDVVVNAYMFGLSLFIFISPTGLLLPALALIKCPLGRYLRWISPLLMILGVLGISALIFQIYFL